MKNILTIAKKEFARFFKDRRLVLSLLLPGVLIYVIYSVLGQGIFDAIGGVSQDYTYRICTVGMPDSFDPLFENAANVQITKISKEDSEKVKEQIAARHGDCDLLAVFSDTFSSDYASPDKRARLTAVYNSARTESAAAYQLFTALLSPKMTLFDVVPEDQITDKDATGMIFSMIAPMLVLMFLMTGCMSIAPESIAGEKERGTFATMLITPVKRSHIAIGKILSLSALSLLSGVCSFLGVVLSLPKLMEGAGESMGISAAAYGAGDYAMLLGVILSSVLVLVALVSILSALAKSVKEATSFVGPMMILVVLFGISTMFTGSSGGSVWLYCIPLYNSARAMSAVFSFAASPLRVLVTVAANVVCALLLSVLLAKMFDSEKIMFNK